MTFTVGICERSKESPGRGDNGERGSHTDCSHVTDEERSPLRQVTMPGIGREGKWKPRFMSKCFKGTVGAAKSAPTPSLGSL